MDNLIVDRTEKLKTNTEAYNLISPLRDDPKFIAFLELVALDKAIAVANKNQALDNGEDARVFRGMEVALDGILDKIDNLERLSLQEAENVEEIGTRY